MNADDEAKFLLTHTKKIHYNDNGVTIYYTRDSDDKLDGPWDSWYDKDFKYKFEQCNYKAGKRNGKYVAWKPKNVFSFKCNYVKGKMSNFKEGLC